MPMKSTTRRKPTFPTDRWLRGKLPANVTLGARSLIAGEFAFKHYRSELPDGLRIGRHCTMDGVHFDLGREGRVSIGDYCYFTNALLLCELEIRIGSYVVIGWNASVTDTDFHPIAPAERIADAIACSPLGKGRPRPPVVRLPVVIEDNAWIGPNASVLKGVRIGAGAFIEAGSNVVHDVPPKARVMGNPARIIGKMP